jgi:hypothetical protein
MSCPETGLKGFPIEVTIPVTPSLNASIAEDLILDIQWATKSTAPRFINSKLEEGDVNNTGSQTSLRIQGTQYYLRSVQVCQPLHTSLLDPNATSSCRAEIVFVFSSSGAYATLCVPLLAGSTAEPSKYLEALRQDMLPGKPISLDTLLPSDLHYTHYTTCIQQIQSQQTVSRNLRVLVFTKGLVYPEASITELKRKINGGYPIVSLPDTLQLGTPIKVGSDTDYKSFFRYGLYTPSKSNSGDSRIRVDSTDAYKCVPLLPQENVKNGVIKVDTEKGELLSQVLKDNNDVQAASTSGPTPADVEKLIAIFFGVSLGIFLLIIAAYAISLYTGTSTEPHPWLFLEMKIKETTPIYFIAMLVGIIGFVIGLLVQYIFPPKK